MNKYKQLKNHIDYIKIIPIVFFAACIFLIVRIHPYQNPLTNYDYLLLEDDILYDFFSYWKMVFVCASAVFSLVLLIYYIATGKRKFRNGLVYIPVGLYALFIIASYIMSDHKDISLVGTVDRFEGTIVQLSYLIMLVYIINMIDSYEEILFTIKCILAGAFAACIIGLTQAAGRDLFTTNLGKLLIGAGGYNVGFEFENGQVYQTIYNINYVAWYLGLIIPVLLLVIGEEYNQIRSLTTGRAGNRASEHRRNLIRGIVELSSGCMLIVLMVVNIYKADSLGSVPGIVLSVLVTVLFILKRQTAIRKKIYAVMCAVTMTAFAFAVFLCVYISNAHKNDITTYDNRPLINRIVTEDNYIDMLVNGNPLKIYCDVSTGEVLATDGETEIFNLFKSSDDKYRYDIDSPRYNNLVGISPLMIDGRYIIVLNLPGENLVFELDGAELKYVNRCNVLVSLEDVEHAGIFKNYRMANGRAYVWDTTIPLLKKYILTGSGADTFMFVFPQEDIAGRYTGGIDIDNVYDKPHNMYLQMAVCTGIASLLCFGSIVIIFLAKSYKKLRSIYTTHLGNPKSNISATCKERIIVALAMGIVAFLIGALFNDSCVSVMPMFYTMLGLGIAALGIEE